MAYIGLKQLDPTLTGSLQVSGSSQLTGSLDVDTNIVAGNRVTSDYGTVNYSLTVNEGGHGGGDFRVESDNNAYQIFSDANQDKVGIGTNSLTSLLTVSGDITATHITASGNISASGDISADDVYIGSDTNTIGYVYLNNFNTTFMQMKRHSGDDKIIMKAGGQSMIVMVKDNGGDPSQIIFNDDGDDLDMRFEGSSDNSLLYLDGSQNSIQLGSAATTHVTASGNINTTDGRIYEAGTSVIDHATAMAIVFGG